MNMRGVIPDVDCIHVGRHLRLGCCHWSTCCAFPENPQTSYRLDHGFWYRFLEQLPDEMAAAIGGFAGGGIIAMICSTMMPEAFEEGGPVVGFIASMGLLVSLLLDL